MQGLSDNVTADDLADFFKQCGVVKVSRGITKHSRASDHKTLGKKFREDISTFLSGQHVYSLAEKNVGHFSLCKD